MSADLNHFTSIFDRTRTATVAGDKENAEFWWRQVQELLPPLIRPVALSFGLTREQVEQDFIPDLLGKLFLVVERFERQPDKRGRAWVRRIAFHMLVNRTREFRRAAPLPDDWEGVLVAFSQKNEELSEQEAQLHLSEAEERLRKQPPEGNPKIIAVYDLMVHQGLTAAQVVEQLNLKKTSVGVYLSKALTALRGVLTREGANQ